MVEEVLTIMKFPLIIAEGLDISFYDRLEDAECSLEAIDVKEGLYEAYDSEGSLLKLSVLDRETPVLFGLMKPVLEHVNISLAEDNPSHSLKLEKLLRSFLKSLNEEGG